jgi:hypothetical protein
MPNNKKLSPDQIEAVNSLVNVNSTNVAVDQAFITTNPTVVGQVLTVSALNTGSHTLKWDLPPPSSGAVTGVDVTGALPGSLTVVGIQGKPVPLPGAGDVFPKTNPANTAFELVGYGSVVNTVTQGNDSRIPTQPENDALVGTNGVPSAANEYVTDSDPRNSDARTPTAHVHSGADITSGVLTTTVGGLGLNAGASTGLPFFDVPGFPTFRNPLRADIVDDADTQTFVAVGTVNPPINHARCDATGGSFALTLGAPGAYASLHAGGGDVWVHKFTAANLVTVTAPFGETIQGAPTFPMTGISGAYFFRPDPGTDWHVGAISTGGGGAPHDLLSATHTDTSPNAVLRGSLVSGQVGPVWGRLVLGPVGQYLRSDGTDILYSAILVADLPVAIPAPNIGTGTVDNTEFGFLNGVTSAIQTQIDNRVPLTRTLTATAPVRIDGIGVADLSANRTLSVNDATTIANGVIRLANHLSGTAIAPVVSDFTLAGAGDANSFKIENLATPTAPSDAATKAYVDGVAGTTTITVQEGDVAVGSGNANTLDFDPNHFNVTEAPANEMNVAVNTGANGLAPLDAGGLVFVANLPVATDTANGVVELATAGEAAPNVVVQGDDPRLPEMQTLSGVLGPQTLFNIGLNPDQFMKVTIHIAGKETVGGFSFAAYELTIFAGRVGVLPAQQIGQVQNGFTRESHAAFSATATVSGNNILCQVDSAIFPFNWTGFAFKTEATG